MAPPFTEGGGGGEPLHLSEEGTYPDTLCMSPGLPAIPPPPPPPPMTRHPTNPVSPEPPQARLSVAGARQARGAGREGGMEGHDPAGCRARQKGQRCKPTPIKQASRP